MREPRLGQSTRWMATFLLVLACNRGEGDGTTAEGRRNEPQPLSRKECSGGSTQPVDVNNDGRADITHHQDGAKRRCSEVDLNFDGKADLLRFYEDNGQSVSFEQHDFDFDGRLDDNNFYKAGKLERKELDTNFDGLIDSWLWCKGPLIEKAERARRKPGRVDTWESYTNGVLSEVKYDENNDGNVEKWDTYRQGALAETRIDTNGDGKPDRTDPAETGGDNQDERVSCDGTPLPAEVPPTEGAFGEPGLTTPPLAAAYDGGVPRALADAGSTVVVRDAGQLAPVFAADAGVARDAGNVILKAAAAASGTPNGSSTGAGTVKGDAGR